MQTIGGNESRVAGNFPVSQGYIDIMNIIFIRDFFVGLLYSSISRAIFSRFLPFAKGVAPQSGMEITITLLLLCSAYFSAWSKEIQIGGCNPLHFFPGTGCLRLLTGLQNHIGFPGLLS
jgi:hypothetical protein